MDIDEVRKHINRIDTAILYLIAERIEIARAAGSYKKENNLPIKSPKRENDIVNMMKEKGSELNLDQKFVEKIYRSLIDESCKVQEDIIKHG